MTSYSQSGYFGVRYRPRRNGARRWEARIGSGGTRTILGYFRTAEDAARAYDREALYRYGPNCRLNFPLERAA